MNFVELKVVNESFEAIAPFLNVPVWWWLSSNDAHPPRSKSQDLLEKHIGGAGYWRQTYQGTAYRFWATVENSPSLGKLLTESLVKF